MARASDEHQGDLIEPEGVNASSDRIGRPQEEGDVVSGGRPQAAPDVEQESVDATDDLVSAPEDTDREPGQPHGSSGQDAGLMD
jgi:hypothetical protein